MSTEIWKPVTGYEGLYEVSNRGRIKSLARWSSMGRNDKRRKFKKEKILKLNPNPKGYLGIFLYKNSIRKRFRVHRLVLAAFGTIPLTPDLEGNHKDFDKANNHINNLEAITGSENIEHYLRHDPYQLYI